MNSAAGFSIPPSSVPTKLEFELKLEPQEIGATVCVNGVSVDETWNGEESKVSVDETRVSGFEPEGFLACIKDAARFFRVRNEVEIMVLKSHLSSFYHAKGFGNLPLCREPRKITVMEENWGHGVSEKSGFNVHADEKERSFSDGKTDHVEEERSLVELMAGDTVSDSEYCSTGAGKLDLPPNAKKGGALEEKEGFGKSDSQFEKKHNARHLVFPPVAVEEEKGSHGGGEIGMFVSSSSSSSRKRNKSKYLSPPYTSLTAKIINSLKNSEVDNRGVRISGQINGARLLLKCLENFQKKACKGFRAEENAFLSSTLRPSKPEDTLNLSFVNNVAAEKLLSNLRLAATDLVHPKKGGLSDSVCSFFLKFRSSLYLTGSDFGTYMQSQPNFKGRKISSSSALDSEGTNQSGGKSIQKVLGGRKRKLALEEHQSSGKDYGKTGHSGGKSELCEGNLRESSVGENGSFGKKDSHGSESVKGKSGCKKRKPKEESSNSKTPNSKSQEVSVEKVPPFEKDFRGSNIEMNNKESNEKGSANLPLPFIKPVAGAGVGTHHAPMSPLPPPFGARCERNGAKIPLPIIKNNLENMMLALTKLGEEKVGSAAKMSQEANANLAGEISGLLKKVTTMVNSSSS